MAVLPQFNHSPDLALVDFNYSPSSNPLQGMKNLVS